MNDNQKKSCAVILKHFGIDAQTDKAIEELLELDEAIRFDTREDIIDEVADVEIMLEQLKEGMNIHHAVDVMIDTKIKRTNKRIGEGYYETV